MKNQIKLLYILGTFRTGKKMIGSLLDSHKNYVVWPNEYGFFYTHWKFIEKKKNYQLFKKEILSHFKKNFNKENILFNISLFNKELKKLKLSIKPEINLKNIFQIILKCQKNKNKNTIKYFCLVTPSILFDFNELNKNYEKKVIITTRDISKCFYSMRNKRLENKQYNISENFYFFFKEMLKLFFRALIDLENHKKIKINYLQINLSSFKKKPSKYLKALHDYNNIKHFMQNLKLTRLGYKYQGNFGDRKLNSAIVKNASSKNKFKILNFEKFYIDIFISLILKNKRYNITKIVFFLIKNPFIKLSILVEKNLNFIERIKVFCLSLKIDYEIIIVVLYLKFNLDIKDRPFGSFFEYQKEIKFN